jgi:RNA polymerase sigma factor (sigma-70 family)
MTSADSAFRRYRSERSDDAFREVVAAHLSMVYNTALRIGGGDAAEAEDVTQMAFADLARKAPALREDAAVGAWLHRHTCFLMKSTIRSHIRRRAREQASATPIHSLSSEASEEGWATMKDHLDHCLESMREADRRALVLRYFEGRDMRKVGEALGIGEDAAQKRVARALEKLRSLLTKKRTAGISATALAALLTERTRAVEVPAEVEATVAGRALKLAAARKGTLTPSSQWPRGRVAAWIASGFGIVLGVWCVWPVLTSDAREPGGRKTGFVSRFGSQLATKKPGDAPAFVYEGVDSLMGRLKILVRQPDTSSNAKEIIALIGCVPFEDLHALVAAIEKTGVSGIRYRSYPGLLERWGNHDPGAMMNWYVRRWWTEGSTFSIDRKWERAFLGWQPANLPELRNWYAAALKDLAHDSGPLYGIGEAIPRHLGHLILGKDPSVMEEFLASFPDRQLAPGSTHWLREDLRNWNDSFNSQWKPIAPPPLKPGDDAAHAEAMVPTPEAYPALRTAFTLPAEEAAQVVTANLQAWAKEAGAAPLQWAYAHLTAESAGRMLDEVIPVWAQYDPAGLRKWYAAGPDPKWWPADPDYTLTERIISALAVQNPVSATEFLLTQCSESLEVPAKKTGWWSPLNRFEADIAAGLNSPDQCREVLILLDDCHDRRAQNELVMRLKSETLTRWKLWDANAAQEWEVARGTK